ncbi:MAG: KOW domain-containing RNA-binding protein [Clostridia bacterium]|nr:KOW domain-containing RNA-binding protein [Clostridia bacterium]
MSFERGCVVRAIAGRDKGRLLAVTRVLQNGIEVCDGKERKLQKPKIKNPKHVEQTRFKVTENELAFDGRLRKALNRISDDTASL